MKNMEILIGIILQCDSKRLVFLLTGTGRKLSSFILNLVGH